jgi:tol-pal system protein YbgF
MTRPFQNVRYAAVLALAVAAATPAFAQDRGPGFLDNLFNRGEQEQQQPSAAPAQSDTTMRLDRIENALRQLTGTIEELQHRNQVLETQVRELQQRAGIQGSPGASPAMPSMPPVAAPSAPMGVPAMPGRRSDVFNPAQEPNAPGAPHQLGATPALPPAAAPREAGAPLDLNTLAKRSPASAQQPVAVASAQGGLPPPPQRNPSATGPQLATLPPSARPQDEYDMAYGYVLHKDYGLAVQAFRDFIRKYPEDRLVPDAQYWMGDAMFRQQQYREAAEAFLAVSTKYESNGKAPDALLKLGQSLAQLHQKEAACATLAQVGRKYPKASARRGAAQELKKLHC